MKTSRHYRLNLRVGEIVEIRSKEEILATLDSGGRLDSLPFMPEMLQYAGQKVRVAARADKTCDTVNWTGLRRVHDAVHLEGLRCDGGGHGGCQAACFLYWKEAWLKRADAAAAPSLRPTHPTACTEGELRASAHPSEDTWSCQATELPNFTKLLPWWDFGQYARDYFSGNVSLWAVARGWFYFLFRKSIRLKGYRAQLRLFAAVQRLRGSLPFPELAGELTKTPADRLDLAPGELVRIKDVDMVRQTLNKECMNRGLTFDGEMAIHCGKTFAVRHRVDHIINERTGKMLNLPGDCIVLEGAVCEAHYHQNCPRAIFPYWREVWLERVEAKAGTKQNSETTNAA